MCFAKWSVTLSESGTSRVRRGEGEQDPEGSYPADVGDFSHSRVDFSTAPQVEQ
jgi:hypothetical protein